MKNPACPSLSCSLPIHGPITGHVVRAGFFQRKLIPRKIARFRCKNCRSYFSSQTLAPTYRQKRPDLNLEIRSLLCSQMTQRRCALHLGISRRTVVRKFRFLARQAASENEERRERLRNESVPIPAVQFDDLLTSIHTKCKPVSVSLAVHAQTREIFSFQVSDIPARHPLVAISLSKYGPRMNERPQALGRLFRGLRGIVPDDVVFRSDRDPEYPSHICKHFPHAVHERVKSRKARTAGFGELKRIGFDPIFSLNHTCAMLRANLNRLARRTWCTSKTKIGLIFHIELYVHYHNTKLIKVRAV